MNPPGQQLYASGGYEIQQPAFPPGIDVNFAFGNPVQQSFMQPQANCFQAPPIHHFFQHADPTMVQQQQAAVPTFRVPALSQPPGLTAPTTNMRVQQRIAYHPYGTRMLTQQQQQLQPNWQPQQPMLQPTQQPRQDYPMAPAVSQFDGGDQLNIALPTASSWPQQQQPRLQQLQQQPVQPVQPMSTMMQQYSIVQPMQHQQLQPQQLQQPQQHQMAGAIEDSTDETDQFVNALMSSPEDANDDSPPPGPSRRAPEATMDLVDLDNQVGSDRFKCPPLPARNGNNLVPTHLIDQDDEEASFATNLPPASPWIPQNRSLLTTPLAPTTRDALAKDLQAMLEQHPDLAEQLDAAIRRIDFEPRVALTRCIEAVDKLAEEGQAKRTRGTINKSVRFHSPSGDNDEENDELSTAGLSLDVPPPGRADPGTFKFPSNDGGPDIEIDLSEAVVEFNEMKQRSGTRTTIGPFTKHVMGKVFEDPRASVSVTAGCDVRRSNKGYDRLPEANIQTLAKFWIQHFKSALLLPAVEEIMVRTIKTFLTNRRSEIKKSGDDDW